MKNKNMIVIFVLLLLNLSFVSCFSPIINADSSGSAYSCDDGYYYSSTGSWDGSRDATTATGGSIIVTSDDDSISVVYNDVAETYRISRVFINFDLSAYSLGTTFTSCTLYVYGYSLSTADVIVVEGDQGTTLETTDFDLIDWTNDFSVEKDTWSTSGYNSFTINADGLTDMGSASGTEWNIVIVEYDSDYLDSGDMDENEKSGCYFSEYTGTDHDIYISFTYLSNPAPLTNFDVQAILGSDTSLYLSWTLGGGDYSHIRYKIGSYPTSITDGNLAYNSTSNSYTLGSLAHGQLYYFSGWSYSSTSHLFSSTYVTDTATVYGRPIRPTLLYSGFDLDDLKDILYWTIGTNATHHRIMYKTNAYPTSITDGTLWYNGTGYSYYDTNSGYISKYFSIWAWDNTCKLWSADYRTGLMTINATCSSGSITVHNQTTYTTDGYGISGLHIWLNYTGIQPTLNHYENIVDATGTHEHKSSNGGHTINVWANYTGDECPPCIPVLHKYQNIINATGWHNSSIVGEDVYVWANYTGNTTPIIQYENIIDATGTHEYILTFTGYKDWANYTGTGGGCSGIVWVNYTDSNITFNVSVNKTDDSNTSTYTILEDFWLYLGSTISLDAFTLLLVYLFAILYFVYSNKTNDLFIRTHAHRIFILFTLVLLFGIEVGEFITDLGMTDLQRAMLLPFIPVFIILLWLIRKPKEEN